MKRILLSLPLALFICQAGQSQIVGNAVYIQGNYVEMGIDAIGGFEGADTVAYTVPVGMHQRSNTQYFGFVANALKDGWVNYDGDFFTPGTPENGWGIEIVDDAGTVNIKASNNRWMDLDIPGSITSYTHTGGIHTAVWEGDFDSLAYDLHFTIEYVLHDSALVYTTTFSVTNNGDDIDVLYYYRNIDPDNNVVLLSDYSTTNTILSQPGGLSNVAEVRAEQFSPWYSSYTLSANDSNARVISGGFSNRNASDIWNGTIYTSAMGASVSNDEAIAISCKMDSLFAFRSARSFSFESRFASDITTGVEQQAKEGLNIYPNPTSGVLHIASVEPESEVTVYNAMGVLQFKTGNISTIDLSALEAGIYLVQVKTEKALLVNRIVKQ